MAKIPIETLDLFPKLDQKLIELLQSLTDEEWHKPTIARLWNVKDIAAHLLDGNIRTLSFSRDKYFGQEPPNIESYDGLIGYLNGLNADWVKAMKRCSPKILTDWLASTGPAYFEQIANLDPFAPAIFSVGWAGDETSPNWFHIAREYTEKWHHQQQIRDAVDKPGIMTAEFYYPFLDTFMMALPHTYRNTIAPENSTLRVTISGEGGGDWFLVKKEKWELTKTSSLPITAHTTIDGSVAWKLFSKSWRRDDVKNHVSIEGDQVLGEKVLDMISVMA